MKLSGAMKTDQRASAAAPVQDARDLTQGGDLARIEDVHEASVSSDQFLLTNGRGEVGHLSQAGFKMTASYTFQCDNHLVALNL